jgi:hypothetical protein
MGIPQRIVFPKTGVKEEPLESFFLLNFELLIFLWKIKKKNEGINT